MPGITREEIVKCLTRLGELAVEESTSVELVLMGGGLMVMAYNARLSTHDLDVLILKPDSANHLRILAIRVAKEFGLELDWLNDAVKGFVNRLSLGPVIFESPGIKVHAPKPEQALAMKLSAWRDDVDISDAARLLAELRSTGSGRDAIWLAIQEYLLPDREQKALDGFSELWEAE